MRKRFLSLRWKIAWLIILATIIFSSITLYITYRYVNRTLTESLVEQGEIVASNISELAAEKLIEEDIVGLRTLIEKYKYFSNVEYVIIADFNNRIITDTFNGNIPEGIRNGHVFQNNTDNKFSIAALFIPTSGLWVYDIMKPIKEGLLGFVRVGINKSYIDQQVRRVILNLGLFFLVGIFLAVILAILVITFQVSRPIAYLTNAAHKISMGELEKPVRLQVKNEIRILAEAIERMRMSLKISIERLQKR